MTHEFTQPHESLRAQTEAYIAERQGWIDDAVEEVTGDRSAPLESVLVRPMQAQNEVRRDSEGIELGAEKEQALREIAGRFGIGGEQDVTLEQAGLPVGYVDVKEGGLAWKVAAEAALTSDSAGTIVYAGSPYRTTNEKERAFQVERLGKPADSIAEHQTEYDVARVVAETQPGFVALPEPEVLPYGYEVNANHARVAEKTGQLTKIGTQNGRDVLLFRVDRRFDDAQPGKYFDQPDTTAIMRFMADYLTATGDTTTAVGVTTSTTYASRAVDAVRAGLENGRQFGVAMYGRQTLADAKGEPVAIPTEINQIPGELRVMSDKLDQLKVALRAVTSE